MALSSASEGSQTATISTEHTLSTETTAATYILSVDCANLANGDTVELRAYVKVRSTSTEAVYLLASYSHAQVEDVKMSIPVPTLHSVKFTLKQTAGTGRAFDWNVIKA